MSIIEEMLLEEYDRSKRVSAALEKEFAELPRGSVRERVISGKKYYYLQFRDGGHVRSLYIPRSEVGELRRLIERRKEVVSAMKEQERSRCQIERALGRRFIDEHTRG